MVGTIDAHWVLDEDAGSTAYDYSGNESHGTISGAGPQGTGTVVGPFGNSAYGFDGSNDRVRVGQYIDGDSVTVTAWVNLDTLVSNSTETSYAVLADYNTTSGDSNFFGLGSGDQVVFSSFDSSASTSYSANGSASVTTGQWYHVAGVFTGSGYRVYLNGALDATSTDATIINTSTNMTIGARHDNSDRYLDGGIADVRVYDRALTPTEVLYLYEAGRRSELVYDTYPEQ